MIVVTHYAVCSKFVERQCHAEGTETGLIAEHRPQVDTCDEVKDCYQRQVASMRNTFD